MIHTLTKYRREIIFVFLAIGIQCVEAIVGSRFGEDYSNMSNCALIITGVCAVVFWLWTPSKLREPWLGLGLSDSIGKHLGIGLLMAVVYYSFSVILPWCLGILTIETNLHGILSTEALPLGGIRSGFFILFIWFVFGIVNALCGEELAFRGYLFGNLEKKSGFGMAVVWSTVVFVVWHLPSWVILDGRLEKPATLMLDAFWLALGTVALCLVFASTRGLYAVSLYHVIVHIKSHVLLCRIDRLTSENISNFFYVYWVNNAILADVFNLAAMIGLISFGLWLRSRRDIAKDHVFRCDAVNFMK